MPWPGTSPVVGKPPSCCQASGNIAWLAPAQQPPGLGGVKEAAITLKRAPDRHLGEMPGNAPPFITAILSAILLVLGAGTNIIDRLQAGPVSGGRAAIFRNGPVRVILGAGLE